MIETDILVSEDHKKITHLQKELMKKKHQLLKTISNAKQYKPYTRVLICQELIVTVNNITPTSKIS